MHNKKNRHSHMSLNTDALIEPQPQPASRRKPLEVAVACGPGGLGLGLDEGNRVTRLVPGGQAERDGLLRVGDLVIAVDGERLGRRTLAEVMPRGHAQYVFTVGRAPAAAAAPAATVRPERVLSASQARIAAREKQRRQRPPPRRLAAGKAAVERAARHWRRG